MPVTKLARLISHQITVDITRLTVPVSAETNKTQIQGLLEKNFYKNSLREETTTGTGKQTQVPAQELKNQVRDIHMKLNNVIKTSLSKADSFQAGNTKIFLEN